MFYEVAVGAWGISPSEFYAMSPEEWWRIHEMKRPKDRQNDYAGRLTERDCEELYELLH